MFFKNKPKAFIIKLVDCDYALSGMEKQLPISYTLLRTIPSNDRTDLLDILSVKK